MSSLVHARTASPIDNVSEPPWVLIQIPLQFTLLIDNQLSRRIQDARTFALVLVVDFNYARGKVERLRLGIKECFAESDLAVGDEDNFSACRGRNILI